MNKSVLLTIVPAIAGLSLAGCDQGASEAGGGDGADDDAATATVAKSSTASGAGCVAGNWILDNTSLAVAMDNNMRRGVNGTDFTLNGIKGDYLARIDTEKNTVVVTWSDWTMDGTAETKRSGTFPVTLRIDGLQEYDLTSITEDSMAVALTDDRANASVTFNGMTASDPKMDIPPLSGGTYTCIADALTLNSEGQTWKFERADY